MGEIVWLGRYPVKSMRGERLDDAQLTASGIAGDRRYALIDVQTGLVASAKHPATWRQLLSMGARSDADGRVTITGPDGAVVDADDPTIDATLSRAVGRPARLSATRPDGASLERLTPETEPAAGTLTRSRLAAGTPGDTFVDFAPVHLLTTATLDAVGAWHDLPRFRPNIVLRMDDPRPFVENAWPGRILTFGEHAAVTVITPTPRCAVPTLAQGDDIAADRDILRRAARLNRVPVLDIGTLTCVGAYAAVHRDGQLRVGDRVIVGDQLKVNHETP